MNTITRSFLCISITMATISTEAASRKIISGVGFVAITATTISAADLTRNYILYPDARTAAEATINDFRPAQKHLKESSIAALTGLKAPARAAHMALFPNKKDCPSVAAHNECGAHGVTILEGLAINGAKAVATELK